jgi:mRNA-degrading endonuclease RelE of RelBE toxin-antitoxin system
VKRQHFIQMQHLLILDYKTDAERKRIDYTIEKWSAKANIAVTKPKGVVVLFEGEDLEVFVEDVYSRMESGASPPKIYSLEESSPTVTKKIKRLSFSTTRNADTLENFVNYLLAKQSAAFEFADGKRKIYAARTRKGHVQIVVTIESGKNVRCLIVVEGYGDVVDFVAGRIEDEMNVFLGGV